MNHLKPKNKMKKVLFASVFAVLFVTGMSSCGRCQVRTKASEPEVRICKGDYGSETEFGFAIDVKESQGYNCKNAL